MTAEDLMIGDWVYIAHCSSRLTPCNGKILSIDGSDNIKTTEGLVDISLIQPIELTEDILFKNFECETYRDSSDYKLCEKGKADMWRIWKNPNYGYIAGALTMDDFGGGSYEPCVPIRYVHELQHFLKVIKSNIKIDL